MTLKDQYNGVKRMRDRPDATQSKPNTNSSLSNQINGVERMTDRPDATQDAGGSGSEKKNSDSQLMDFGSFKVTPR